VGDDIGKFVSDIVSPWLGSKPATPPQVVRGKEVVKTLVQQADIATGGYGRAAMAGPSELAKQAAVNLAAGGVGYGVGRMARVALSKAAPSLMQDIGVHFSTNKNIGRYIKASPSLRGTGKGPSTKANFEVNVDVARGKTYKFAGSGPTLGSSTRPGQTLPASKFQDFMSDQDTAYVTQSRLGRVDPENPALYVSPKSSDWFERGGKFQSQRMTGRQNVVEVVADRYGLTNAVIRARGRLSAQRRNLDKANAVVGIVAFNQSNRSRR
jgi:hypothetical protein